MTSGEMDSKDSVAARKVLKADREKLRRDRLNEHFILLGNTLDSERPKNDKATILNDTIQELKDLTTEVCRLKAEYAALSEESRELTQEKQELREEKVSLKSKIDNLNLQYQQRVGVVFPWSSMDPSVVLTSPYTYPYPMPVRHPHIPIHPTLQPFPFFGSQIPVIAPTPSSTYMPYPIPPANPPMEQVPIHCTSQNSSQTQPKRKSPDYQNGNPVGESDVLNDVATELELKMPGSSTQQEKMSESKKGKQLQSQEDSESITVGSCSSKCSSLRELQDNSSHSISNSPKRKN